MPVTIPRLFGVVRTSIGWRRWRGRRAGRYAGLPIASAQGFCGASEGGGLIYLVSNNRGASGSGASSNAGRLRLAKGVIPVPCAYELQS